MQRSLKDSRYEGIQSLVRFYAGRRYVITGERSFPVRNYDTARLFRNYDTSKCVYFTARIRVYFNVCGAEVATVVPILTGFVILEYQVII